VAASEPSGEADAGRKKAARRGPARTVRTPDAIARVAQMICEGYPKHEIKKWLANRLGRNRVAPSQVEQFMSEARAQIREAAKAPKADKAAESLAFYEWMKHNPKATPRERLFAQERIDELLGLSAKYASEAEKTDSAAEFARKAHEAMREMLDADLGGTVTASEAKGKE